MRLAIIWAPTAAALVLLTVGWCHAEKLTGTIREDRSGQPVAARLYIRSEKGEWHFAAVTDPAGKAVPYKKQRSDTSVEMHTAVSAHAFVAELPPGKYTLTVERGKEYLPAEQTVEISDKPVNIEIKLHRWIDMAERGWYSGDTHVHRTLDELPTAMLADDLNVALPLTYWVTKSDTPPAQGDKNLPPVEAKVIEVAPQARHLAAEHRVRDFHRRRQAAHAGGGVWAGTQDGPQPRRAACATRSPSRSIAKEGS